MLTLSLLLGCAVLAKTARKGNIDLGCAPFITVMLDFILVLAWILK